MVVQLLIIYWYAYATALYVLKMMQHIGFLMFVLLFSVLFFSVESSKYIIIYKV